MNCDHRILDFAAVDDLGFAGIKRRLDLLPAGLRFTGELLGPLLELRQLQHSGTLPPETPPWFDAGAMGDLARALGSSQREWFSPGNQSTGFLRLDADPRPLEWTDFAIRMKRAGLGAGLSSDWAAQMTAALREMESNICEHSGVPSSGLLAYRATPGRLEFAATDLGLGVLATLRQAPDYAHLDDHGEALRLTLTDGASRLGAGLGRGYGFRPLFIGLANRDASMRFRSGTASLTIDGRSPNLVQAQLASKPPLNGFFASICCTVRTHVPN